ncbi:MAG: arginyltransferase [Gammaproteobacteria bacterium]|nr:MAG: arginyltransferase [Gammaproteobacteria bacterium]
MSNPKQNIEEIKLGFYVTPEHECNYLPGKNAQTVFADPDFPMNENIYTTLASHGFRRSGNHIYKPQCQQCHACIAIRLPVTNFTMSRNQKRNWARNKDLKINKLFAEFDDEHFDLYQRYLAARHPDGDMGTSDLKGFISFLTTNWATTVFYEFRKKNKLLAVAVVDELVDGLSAVYTFFDPDESNRSLGRYAVLTEIEMALNRGLQWLYLGYWIADCRKMQYKDEYQPLEYYYQKKWHHKPPQDTD